MANLVYPKGREAFLNADIDMLVDDIRAILINITGTGTTYTYSAAHEFLTSVPSGARIGVSPSLTSKSTTDGVFDAADPTVLSVSGDIVEGVILYKHTGADATARLISYHDRADDGTTLLSLTPDGGNVVITWPNDAERIFTI